MKGTSVEGQGASGDSQLRPKTLSSNAHSPLPTLFKPLKLIFMGTPEFALPSLKALREAGHEIVAVYSQPPRPAGRGQKETPSPIHHYALSQGLKVLTPVSLKGEAEQREFASFSADAAIVAAYGLLLPPEILKGCKLGCINIHPSLLPRWRGAAPIQRTIMAGDTKTGICIMQMDEGLDTGDVLACELYDIPEGTTSGQLHDTLAQRSAPLLLNTLERLSSIMPQKQSGDGVTYAKKISKSEARIDWSKPADEILCLIRGMNPYPGANFEYQGEVIKLLAADICSGSGKAGEVLDDTLTIACGNGAIRPLTLQRPGKKPMPAEEVLRGLVVPKGTLL